MEYVETHFSPLIYCIFSITLHSYNEVVGSVALTVSLAFSILKFYNENKKK